MNTIDTDFFLGLVYRPSQLNTWNWRCQFDNYYWVVLIKIRYSAEPKFRQYVKGHSFLLFARKFRDKYGKKLKDTATKTGIEAAKAASKRVVQKTAEAT